MLPGTRKTQGRLATHNAPHGDETPNLTTYPRKIKHLHDDT
jgi:hypothetical protein